MENILLVESSPRRQESFSRKLGRAVIKELAAKNPRASIQTRDLSAQPAPHLEEAHLAAFFAPAEKHSAADQAAVRHSEEFVAEVLQADTIVISVPTYNFSVPSVLKAWIDHLARAGKTFKYGANGPEGLVKGKKVYLAISSGAVFSDGPYKAYDFVEPYLRAILGFLGMTDVTTFRVEGVALPGIQDTALEKAIQSIRV